MLKNKMKKILCGVAICVTVCSQVIFPQAVFAATKKAVEKAGEEFVAAMEADADESAELTAESVDSENAEQTVESGTAVSADTGAEVSSENVDTVFLLRRVWITQKLRKRHRVDQQRKN